MTAAPATTDCARQSLLADLRLRVERLAGPAAPADDRTLSTGSPVLDRLLPGGGLARGSLAEYLSAGPGCGAATLALAAAREACREGRALVVLDRQRTFYPPAAAAWGIDLAKLVVVRPADTAAQLWATDQALRSPGVGAVLLACGALGSRDFRRLQLAAETGGSLGLLIRPARLRGQPSWAQVQWEVSPSPAPLLPTAANPPWRLRVELVRCRGGPAWPAIDLELEEATGMWQAARPSHATHPVPAPARAAASG
jgi:protein ImuA